MLVVLILPRWAGTSTYVRKRFSSEGANRGAGVAPAPAPLPRHNLRLRLRDLGTINTAYFLFVIAECCATWSDLALAPQTQSPLARLAAAYPALGSRRHSFTKGAAVFPEGILRRSVGKAYRRPVEFLRAEFPYRAKAEKVQITGRNGYGKSYIRGPMWAEAIRSAPRT